MLAFPAQCFRFKIRIQDNFFDFSPEIFWLWAIPRNTKWFLPKFSWIYFSSFFFTDANIILEEIIIPLDMCDL